MSNGGNQEYNSLNNVFFDQGVCKIVAKKEFLLRKSVSWMDDTVKLSDGLANLRHYIYSSANIWSKKKFGFGKYEIRCKIPSGMGFWPAFWLYGNDQINKEKSSEIDVFEFWSGNTKEHHMT